jgi:hypothetical protein
MRDVPSAGAYIANLGSMCVSSKTWNIGVARPPTSALIDNSALTYFGGRNGKCNSTPGSAADDIHNGSAVNSDMISKTAQLSSNANSITTPMNSKTFTLKHPFRKDNYCLDPRLIGSTQCEVEATVLFAWHDFDADLGAGWHQTLPQKQNAIRICPRRAAMQNQTKENAL